MATIGWLTLGQTSGSGNQAVALSAQNFEGRVNRTMALVVSAPGTDSITVSVIQSGIGVDTTTTNNNPTWDKTAGTYEIVGSTNALIENLNYSITQNMNNIGLGTPKLNINSEEYTIGQHVTYDPGALGKYTFKFQFTISANETIQDKTSQVIVTDGSNSIVYTITQSAGDPYLGVTNQNHQVILQANGSSVNLNIESNTSWSITQMVS